MDQLGAPVRSATRDGGRGDLSTSVAGCNDCRRWCGRRRRRRRKGGAGLSRERSGAAQGLIWWSSGGQELYDARWLLRIDAGEDDCSGGA